MIGLNEYCLPTYPRFDVNIAGKLLGRTISEGELEQAKQAFRVAYNWRDAHVLPMTLIRRELLGLMRGADVKGITAARPKRMTSIRKKLTDPRNEIKLSQMQDLAGCRAIVPDSDALKSILTQYLDGKSRSQIKHKDYICRPRDSGYRGHHIIARFSDPRAPEEFQHLKVEVQLRTKLQHAWATAVESAGLILNADLKRGEGPQEWLRLFQLVSSAMALKEGAASVPGTPSDMTSIKEELCELNDTTKALSTLERYNQAFRLSEEYLPKTDRPYYVLRYNIQNNSVTISSFQTLKEGVDLEHAARDDRGEIVTVLVQVDKVANLREAYPNYFMDVREFTSFLSELVGSPGLSAKELNVGVDVSWVSEYQRLTRKP